LEPLKYLNRYLLRYKWALFLGMIFIILSNLFAIVLAPIVRMAVDTVADGLIVFRHFRDFDMNREIIELFTTYSLFFAGLVLVSALIKGVFMYLMRQTIIVVSRHIEFDLKNDIYEQYQKLSASFYGRNFTGDLMNRISEDVSRVRMYLGPAIMYTVNLVFMFVMVISVMFAINPMISFYVLLPLPFLSISIYYVSDIINRRSDQIQSKLSDMTTFVQQAFAGVRVIKAFGVEDDLIRDFSKENEAYKEKSMNLVKVNALFFPLMLMLVGLSVILTVWIGGKEVVLGNFTLGNIAEYIIYVNMLTWPVASLGWVTSLVQRAAASQQRINKFLALKPEITSKDNLTPVFDRDIEFRNVTFSYPGKETAAINNLSFTLKKGEKLGIVGLTGSGKSTVASLMMRLYDPISGEILVDGMNIKKFNVKAYRNLFGYIPQDVFLFSDTIEENIAFGLQHSPDPKTRLKLIQEAAQDADVLKDIQEFELQFKTMLGERGITLSGGQKQRVAIARAIIRNPAVLLLDDSLSAVDTQTESVIKGNLDGRIATSTAVYISHRVSVVDDADFVIVLDKGSIIESGSPEMLNKLDGLYAALKTRQKASANPVG